MVNAAPAAGETATARGVAGPVLKLSAVERRFGAVTAVRDLSLAVHQGEVVALLGPNGAGKTTALEMILGLLRPSAGSVAVFGLSPSVAIAGGHVGAMLQQAGLPTGAKVAELIDLVRRLCQRPLDRDELLRRSGLEPFAGRRVETLSGGEQQRLRFALALAPRPDLLVLDEPTSAMDVAGRRSFWERTGEYVSGGRSLLFTTHRLEEAEQVAGRVVVLSAGCLVADGSPRELRAANRAGRTAISFRAEGIAEPLLAGLAGVEQVSVGGDRVTLTSSDPDRTVRELLAVASDVEGLEVTPPRLEDAFMALTDRDGRE